MKLPVLILIAFCWIPLLLFGQSLHVKGTVLDARSKEPVLFANVYLAEATAIGTTTDENGLFQIRIDARQGKNLETSALGYVTRRIPLDFSTDTLQLQILLDPEALAMDEIVVVAGENPANRLIRRLIASKSANDVLHRDSFAAELYSKIEVDLVGISTNLSNNPLLRSFDFVWNQVDSTSEARPFLPSYFSENVIQLFVHDGQRIEVPVARKVTNVGNESAIRMINMIHDRFDLYGNWITVMDKAFAGPFSDNGLANYEYYLIDSTWMDGRWSYQLKFKPRRKQEFTFTGTCWIDSLSAALRSVEMSKSPDVNINLLYRVDMKGAFRYSVSGWVPDREETVLEIALGEQERLPGLIARKTNIYLSNTLPLPAEIPRNPDPRTFDVRALEREESYWVATRPEPLARRESAVYAMVDSIGQSPRFKQLKKIGYVLGSGYIPWGMVEFGPAASTYSTNSVEGARLRFGMGSSLNWSKKWWIYGYAAFGQLDQRYKFGGQIQWQPSKRPWTTYKLSYKDDLELSFSSSGEVSEDNFFASLIRRPIPQKLMYTRQASAYWERDFTGGWTAKFLSKWQQLEPYTRQGLGFPFYFQEQGADAPHSLVRNLELDFRLRWAPADIYLETNFSRILTGSQDSRPAVEPFYTLGVFGKNTVYHHLGFRIGQWFNAPPFGWTRYHIAAGVLTNTLPALLLHSPTANETFYYVPNAFNTLARYEFVSDTYLDALLVHHFDGFFLNHIPLLRRLKWREVATLRVAYGSLRDNNKQANALNFYHRDYADYKDVPIPGEGVYYGTFDKGPLLEAGLGIENIFKVLRIDATWRLNYLHNRYAVPLSLRGVFTFYF